MILIFAIIAQPFLNFSIELLLLSPDVSVKNWTIKDNEHRDRKKKTEKG